MQYTHLHRIRMWNRFVLGSAFQNSDLDLGNEQNTCHLSMYELRNVVGHTYHKYIFMIHPYRRVLCRCLFFCTDNIHIIDHTKLPNNQAAYQVKGLYSSETLGSGIPASAAGQCQTSVPANVLFTTLQTTVPLTCIAPA